MNKLLIALCLSFAAVSLTSCASLRDDLAYVIETEDRKTRPDRVRTEIRYIDVPEEYLTEEACPPPIELTLEEITALETEEDYNDAFVIPLYSNNEKCYLNTKRIKAFNQVFTDAQEELITSLGLNAEEVEIVIDDDNN